jgi:uncharacterized membrane protein
MYEIIISDPWEPPLFHTHNNPNIITTTIPTIPKLILCEESRSVSAFTSGEVLAIGVVVLTLVELSVLLVPVNERND